MKKIYVCLYIHKHIIRRNLLVPAILSPPSPADSPLLSAFLLPRQEYRSERPCHLFVVNNILFLRRRLLLLLLLPPPPKSASCAGWLSDGSRENRM